MQQAEIKCKNPEVSTDFDNETLEYQQRRREWRRRQAEGIAAAKARGVHCGRPKVSGPPNLGMIIEEWSSRRLTLEQVLTICNMSSATFFRRVREYRAQKRDGEERVSST